MIAASQNRTPELGASGHGVDPRHHVLVAMVALVHAGQKVIEVLRPLHIDAHTSGVDAL